MSKEKVERVSTFFKMNYSSSSFFFLLANNPALAAANIDATLIVPPVSYTHLTLPTILLV